MSMKQTSHVTNLGARFLPSSTIVNTDVRYPEGPPASGTRQLLTDSSQNASATIPSNIGNNNVNAQGDASRLSTLASIRGRPKGRRPLRGQFPVVPIDMVRQLGIEQQVILQPAAPVAMRNKAILSKPLCMSRRTQCEPMAVSIETQTEEAYLEVTSGMGLSNKMMIDKMEEKEEEKPRIKYIPLPIPIPIYIPMPAVLYQQSVPYALPFFVPTPIPIPLLIEDVSQFKTLDKMMVEEDTTTTTTTTTDVTSKTGEEVIKAEKTYKLKYTYGVNALRHWVSNVNNEVQSGTRKANESISPDLSKLSAQAYSEVLTGFVSTVKKPTGEEYSADSLYYLCLGIQISFHVNNVVESSWDIFNDKAFDNFNKVLNQRLANFKTCINNEGLLVCRLEEDHFWEALQLGTDTPCVLLFTVFYMISKHCVFDSVEQHLKLSMNDVKVVEQKNSSTLHITLSKDKFDSFTQDKVIKICDRDEDDEKSFVKIWKFYISKCKKDSKGNTSTRANSIYFSPIVNINMEKLSQVKSWFTQFTTSHDTLWQLFYRSRMIKEIQEEILKNS